MRVVVLEGDQTGQELLEQALRVLSPDLLGLDLELERFDLSLASRRATSNLIVERAAAAMRSAGLGLKAATITPEGAARTSAPPNRILREQVDGKVIVRTGRRLPGMTPIAGVHCRSRSCGWPSRTPTARPSSARASPARPTEIAYRTEHVTRSTCHAVAEYAFRTAAKLGARVYGGPKWTVSPVYEGMLKEELDSAAARHPRDPLPAGADRRHLRRAAVGRNRLAAGDPGAQPRRRLPVGPGPADVRLDRRGRVGAAGVRRSLRHDRGDGRGPTWDGSRPGGQGRGQSAGDDPGLRRASAPRRRPPRRRLRARLEGDLRGDLETVASGIKTPDLGGGAGTTEFTSAVVQRIAARGDRRNQ